MLDEKIKRGIRDSIRQEFVESVPAAALPTAPNYLAEIPQIVHECEDLFETTLPAEFAMVEQASSFMQLAQRLLLWSLVYGIGPKRYLEIGI